MSTTVPVADPSTGTTRTLPVLAMQLEDTDAAHLALDRKHASANGTDPADRILSTAIFYLGEAVKASSNPERALRALQVALGMTTVEG